MLKERPPRTVPLRYSPTAIDAYNVTIAGGLTAGPGTAALLRDDVQAWNLAFLSHQYEARAEHYDEQFTVLVRRTVNTVLADGSLDLVGRLPARHTVRSLLQLPAPAFIDEICSRTTLAPSGRWQLLERLPMYIAYGDDWMETMRMRADMCLRAPVASEFEPGDEVPHVNDAAALLKKF